MELADSGRLMRAGEGGNPGGCRALAPAWRGRAEERGAPRPGQPPGAAGTAPHGPAKPQGWLSEKEGRGARQSRE